MKQRQCLWVPLVQRPLDLVRPEAVHLVTEGKRVDLEEVELAVQVGHGRVQRGARDHPAVVRGEAGAGFRDLSGARLDLLAFVQNDPAPVDTGQGPRPLVAALALGLEHRVVREDNVVGSEARHLLRVSLALADQIRLPMVNKHLNVTAKGGWAKGAAAAAARSVCLP